MMETGDNKMMMMETGEVKSHFDNISQFVFVEEFGSLKDESVYELGWSRYYHAMRNKQ